MTFERDLLIYIIVGIVCAVLGLLRRPDWDGDVSEEARERSVRR